MYKAILFDLDGTLTDPKEGITRCVQYALEKSGIKPPPKEALLGFIGPPLFDSFCEFFHMSPEEAHQAVAYYRERFSVTGLFENKVFDGVPKLLDQLKKSGKIIVLATAKPHVFARRILEHYHLIDQFDLLVGAELDGTRGHKTEVIEEALKNLPAGISAVMVGDRRQDIEGAKACGIPSIGVRFGYAEPGELEAAGADLIVDSVPALLEALLQ